MRGSEREQRGNIIVIEEFMHSELGLRGAALLVYAVIYSFCKNAGSFYASVEYLAERCRISRRTVYNALRELCTRGDIVKLGRHSIYGTAEYGISSDFGICIEGHEAQSEDPTVEKAGIAEAVEIASNVITKDKAAMLALADKAASVETVATVETAASADKVATAETADKAATVEMVALAEVEKEKMRSKGALATCANTDKERCGEAEDLRIGAREKYMRMQSEITKNTQEMPHRDAYFDDIPRLAAFKPQSFGDIPKDCDRFEYYYFNGFDRYGLNELVLLTYDQHKFLSDWVGADTADHYIQRLDYQISTKPSFRSFSHFKTIKKWIMQDMRI